MQLDQSQAGFANQPEKQITIYERHAQAVQKYHQACRTFVEAHATKDTAFKILADTTNELAQIMEKAQHDPTQPQPGPPMNGRTIPGY